MAANNQTDVSQYDAAQVRELAEHNVDFLSALALPMITEYAYPDFYHYVYALIMEKANLSDRDFSKLALGMPRGFAKTSFIKLCVLAIILFTQKRFIIYIGNTEQHAINALTDITNMLSDTNIVSVFGDYRVNVVTDKLNLKIFGFNNRKVILAGIGQGGSIRGINTDNARPDVMIFDDIQSREEADSKTVSEAIETWLYGTAMKAAAHYGCLYIFLANMYPTKHSILRKLKTNPEWIKLIVGGILANGTSLWEELKPIKQLLAEYRNDLSSGHPEIFYSEVLNDEEANLNTTIDLSAIPAYPFDETDERLHSGTFIIIDPSNDKINSDAVSITGFFVLDGKPIARHIISGRLSPGETIRRALQLAMQMGSSLIVCESNAYQYTLLYWFGIIAEQIGITGIAFEPVYSGSRAKSARILDMFKSLTSGEMYLHPSIKSIVYSQIRDYQPLKKDNVDGILDCLTYAPRVLTELSKYITINSPVSIASADNEPIGDAYETNSF